MSIIWQYFCCRFLFCFHQCGSKIYYVWHSYQGIHNFGYVSPKRIQGLFARKITKSDLILWGSLPWGQFHRANPDVFSRSSKTLHLCSIHISSWTRKTRKIYISTWSIANFCIHYLVFNSSRSTQLIWKIVPVQSPTISHYSDGSSRPHIVAPLKPNVIWSRFDKIFIF